MKLSRGCAALHQGHSTEGHYKTASEKTLMLGKTNSKGEGVTDAEMLRHHQQLNGCESEQTLEITPGPQPCLT